MNAVLIATLGAEAQVVSLATQLLLQRGERLCHVIVIHSDPSLPPIQNSLVKVQTAFAAQPTWPQLHSVVVPTSDILTPDQLDTFAQTLFQLIKHWVAEGMRIHLLLAGGRKSMAMIGMSVAQLLLGPEDHIWYLHSDDELRKSSRDLLEQGDQVTLIEIPLTRTSPAPPQLTRSFQADTPAAARRRLVDEQQRHLQRFLEHGLTPAEREVALLVARDVLTVKEIALRLNKSAKTVTNQLNTIYSKLESEFDLQPDVGVKREFLRRELGREIG